MFQRVIVPLDGSEVSEQGLKYAIPLAEKFGARLVLLRAFAGPEQSARMLAMAQADPVGGVDPRTVDVVTEAVHEQEEEVRSYLAEQAQQLAARGLEVEALNVDADPKDAILQEAHRQPDTVVVMTSHGRGGLQRLVFGSVAQEVIQRCHAPVLVIRASSGATTSGGHDTGHDVSIGAEVMGTAGRLGTVHRLVIDANVHRITGIVVRHGAIFGQERVVPMDRVSRIEGGVVYVNVDERGFAALDRFAEDRYRTPDPDFTGPPGLAREHYVLDSVAAEGPMGALTPPARIDTVPVNRSAPADSQRPAVAAGTDVFDDTGEKVGDVAELSVHPETGTPTQLTIRRGRLFRHDTAIPVEWIANISEKGVELNVSKSRIESWENAER